MPSFILTGAPGAGKTAVLRLLEVNGHPVIEEAATDVIALGHALGLAEPWQDRDFIGQVLALQRRRQGSVLAGDGAVVFFDRSPGHRRQADQLRGLAALRADPRAGVQGAGVPAGGGAGGAARRPRRADQADGRPDDRGPDDWQSRQSRLIKTPGLNRIGARLVQVDEAGGLNVDGRLMADLGRIWQVSGRLSWVEREFSDPSQFTDEDGAFLGSVDLAEALQACVTGWSQQRAVLFSRLSNVVRLSALAASSYEKTDAQLAAVLEKAMSLP